jgi:hypothetical protein
MKRCTQQILISVNHITGMLSQILKTEFCYTKLPLSGEIDDRHARPEVTTTIWQPKPLRISLIQYRRRPGDSTDRKFIEGLSE